MNPAKILIASLLIFVVPGAFAVIETYEFSDPALEQRYQKLSFELRCPKCQNQNIADSNAPIAQDLRKLLHQQLEKGASDEQILDYMEERYGEFVRYRPKFSGATAVLWLAPAILLLVGLAVLVLTIRKRNSVINDTPAELTAEENKQIELLLNAENQQP
jgi:cytochrome c-type biogenesis protein CcmH